MVDEDSSKVSNDINNAKSYDQGSRKNGFVDYIKEWCVTNSMNNKKIKEFLNVMRDIESVIQSKLDDNVELRADLPSGGYNELGNVVATLFAQAYSDNLLIRARDKNSLRSIRHRPSILLF